MDELAWERRDGESTVAFTAFTIFRDLGPSRSLLKAYNAHRKAKEKRSVHRASGQWNQWAVYHKWRDRAEAYDAHLEREARKDREREHSERMQQHRDRQRELAIQTIDASIELLKKASEKLAKLSAKDIPPQSLPQFFRAAAAVAQAGTNSEAQALAIDQLLGVLSGDNQS